MVKKHTIRKETNIDGETGDINIVEEHVIIEKHEFLQIEEDEEEEDLMFLSKKETEVEEEDSPTLYIINNDDNFW
jgi:hypothetical protein